MIIKIVTLFKDSIQPYFNESILKRAAAKGLYDVEFIDLRQYSNDKHHHVDDTPYSDATGMLIKVDVVKRCLDAIRTDSCVVIATTPVAPLFKQKDAIQLSRLNKDIIILCGHYEGFDARVYNYCDYRYSIGDFVVTGGEIAALAISDAIIRLIPDAISQDSLNDESFNNNLLEYDQYTRPVEFDGMKVPEVLVNGNHQLIKEFKKQSSYDNTLKYRPDLLNEGNEYE